MKLNIGQLVYAGFSLVIGIMMFVAYWVWDYNAQTQLALKEIKNDDVPGVILYLQLLDELGDMQANSLQYLTGNETKKNDFSENLNEFHGFFNQLIPLESGRESDKKNIQIIKEHIDQYAAGIEKNVFQVYDPKSERLAYEKLDRLEKNSASELEVLLDQLKEQEFNDAMQSIDLEESLRDDLPGVRFYLELIDEAGDMMSSIGSYLAGDVSKIESFKKDAQSFEEYLSQLKPLETKPSELEDIKRIEFLYQDIKNTAEDIFSTFDSQSKVKAMAYADKVELEILDVLEEIITMATDEEVGEAVFSLDKTYENILQLNNILVVVTPLAAISAFFIAFFIATLIKRRLSRINILSDIAERISNGDLTADHIKDKTNDEVSQLSRAVNQMSDSLNEIISDVNRVSSSAERSSLDIKMSSQESSVKCKEQEDKALMLASAIEEMSATAAEVANQSSAAFDNSRHSGEQARQGGKVVDATIQGINDLSQVITEASHSVNQLGERSSEIGDIIGVIDSIAEQTNLLALNAAIEAARAGEAGRGFAVVADEVRSLAARTTEATTQVADSIGSIQGDTKRVIEQISAGSTQAEKSVELASEAGLALKNIEEAFNNLNSMIESIAASAEEQSSTAKVMAEDVSDISSLSTEVSNISSKIMEQTISMEVLSGELASVVGRFKTR